MTPAPAVEKVELPARIERLNDLAYNLWWTWSKPARALFAELHPVLWHVVEHNPVLFLHRIEAERLVAASANPAFLARYDTEIAAFDAMMNQPKQQTWLGVNRPEMVGKTVAYFSAEFGLHRALPIYSGAVSYTHLTLPTNREV